MANLNRHNATRHLKTPLHSDYSSACRSNIASEHRHASSQVPTAPKPHPINAHAGLDEHWLDQTGLDGLGVSDHTADWSNAAGVGAIYDGVDAADDDGFEDARTYDADGWYDTDDDALSESDEQVDEAVPTPLRSKGTISQFVLRCLLTPQCCLASRGTRGPYFPYDNEGVRGFVHDLRASNLTALTTGFSH